MFQHLIIQFLLRYLLSGGLQKSGDRNFPSFSSKSGRGCLREVVAYNSFQISWFDLKTFSFWNTGYWG